MRDIAPGVVLAGIASAALVYRRKIGSEFGIHDDDLTSFRVDGPVPPEPGRRHAVEKIYAIFHSHEKIFRLADTQKMAGLFFRQNLVNPFNCRRHIFLCETSPDAKAVERQRADELR